MTTTSKKARMSSRTELAPRSYWDETRTSEHFVQFYETDECLLDSLSGFIGTGLAAGDVCIVVATKAHRDHLEERLKASGLDLAAAHRRGEYISQDAAETLSRFMVEGLPEPGRFAEVVGNLVTHAAKGRRHVRIFGEMVMQLWTEKNQAAVIRLEELWNDLLNTTSPFSLFCAYAMPDFAGQVYEGQFTEICKRHSHVIPGESYTALTSSEERLHAITLLQQKANSLEAEIAERKAAEERLRISENRYRRLFEASKDGILILDACTGTITEANPSSMELLGYSNEQLLGQELWQIGLLQHQKASLEVLREVQENGFIRYETSLSQTTNGQRQYIELVGTLYQANGHQVIQCIIRDITERKRLEAKRLLFDSNLISVFISDFAGVFLDANDAFLHLLGYTRAELQAGTMQRDTLASPQFHPLSHHALQVLQETGSSGTYEKECRHKSGKPIPVLVAATRIERTETCIGFVLDISERKELDRRKDEFIRMASHELKTPVTSLQGFLGVLQLRLETAGDEKTLHDLDRMETQVNRLTQLISDLLDLSKMQTGQLAYREERFEADALVQEIVENIQGTTRTHHLLLEGQTQAEVCGDRDRIGQVLSNLLNNAIKFSPHADTVRVRVAKDQNEVCVSIQDFGIGIAKEHQHKIFERFYQVTGPEEKAYPGLGIGLYICEEIVRRHGGHMWVESKKGAGATFHVTLPLLRDEKKSAFV